MCHKLNSEAMLKCVINILVLEVMVQKSYRCRRFISRYADTNQWIHNQIKFKEYT